MIATPVLTGPFVLDPRVSAVEPVETEPDPDGPGVRFVLIPGVLAASVVFEGEGPDDWHHTAFHHLAGWQPGRMGLGDAVGIQVYCVSETNKEGDRPGCGARALRTHSAPPLMGRVVRLATPARWLFIEHLHGNRPAGKTSTKRRLPDEPQISELPAPLRCPRCKCEGQIRPPHPT